jgi:hypothetical protein
MAEVAAIVGATAAVIRCIPALIKIIKQIKEQLTDETKEVLTDAETFLTDITARLEIIHPLIPPVSRGQLEDAVSRIRNCVVNLEDHLRNRKPRFGNFFFPKLRKNEKDTLKQYCEQIQTQCNALKETMPFFEKTAREPLSLKGGEATLATTYNEDVERLHLSVFFEHAREHRRSIVLVCDKLTSIESDALQTLFGGDLWLGGVIDFTQVDIDLSLERVRNDILKKRVFSVKSREDVFRNQLEPSPIWVICGDVPPPRNRLAFSKTFRDIFTNALRGRDVYVLAVNLSGLILEEVLTELEHLKLPAAFVACEKAVALRDELDENTTSDIIDLPFTEFVKFLSDRVCVPTRADTWKLPGPDEELIECNMVD